MAYNEKLAQRLRESFADIPNVEEKRMFRGITFMVNGKMCVSVGDDEIMCRIDPAIHEQLLETKPCLPMIMKGKEMKGYVLVNGTDIKTKKALDEWISLALDFNKRAKAARKRK